MRSTNNVKKSKKNKAYNINACDVGCVWGGVIFVYIYV